MKKFFSKKSAIIISVLLVSVLSFGFIKSDLFEISKNLDIFNNLYLVLNESYVDETKPGQLMKTGIDAMLESLDPYTNYISETDIEDFNFTITGEYGGIGALVTDIEGKIIVVDPYEGFSAQKNGIRSGDEIVEVNGASVKGKRSDDVRPLLKGQAGSPIKLTVIHAGQTTPVVVNLMREEVRVKSVPYFGLIGNQSTGYIKLTQFTENCSQQVKEALVKLKEKNARNIILDLRGNPGGLLQEAVNIVNLFTEKGNEVVFTKGKVKEWDRPYPSVYNPVDLQTPLVVLIDENAASASEIVAGSLQDFDRAVLVGRRSYGKGLVQQTRDLAYNAKLRVTVAKYYIPSGRCIQALDYTHKNEDGRVEKVPDSLITAFKTKHGRVVYDGAGILPDVNVEEQKVSNIAITLLNKNLIFNYATQYALKHNTIAPAKDFQLTDAEFTEFMAFLRDRDIKYKTESELALDEFKLEAEKEKYYTAIKPEFDALVNKMQADKKDDLTKFKTEIKEFLEEEIVSRYYYQNGRIELGLKADPEVKVALEVVNDETKMKNILTTIEKPTKPFNPAKRF
jgi:carboxyl-terminal processing protease